ncbi:MAG: type I DNA topoisomerase [Planctomycetes bacterium]|nr:type I DNA topoisomerase [Planctomycetota bacterium]
MAKKSQPAGKSLVIVESPAKAKTINRYLGPAYDVQACMGHIRDLPPHELGIDFENDFAPVYEILADKKKVVASLKKAAANATEIFLATDLDREGEAIAWHLVHALDLNPKRARRVVFNEITKSAIKAAFEDVRDLDMNKVNAQQARRLLDRIVGYQLSPLLQAKIARGLSAGRVQSVAVRVIVERELEIRAFAPEESWRISGCFCTDPQKAASLTQSWEKFLVRGKDADAGPTVKQRNAWLSKNACLFAELVRVGGKEFAAGHVDDAIAVMEALGFVTENVEEQAWEAYAKLGLKTIRLQGRCDPAKYPRFTIKDIQKRRTTTKPNPPFTTATLQQAASSSLGFGPSRTMRVAQQLYEGINLGGKEGQVALITYMRTDSKNLSKDSMDAARKLIGEMFGEKHLPSQPNYYAKAKRAQEAHEAIRPTDVTRHPDALRTSLAPEQVKLYDLVWRRFVACQMTPAQWDSTTVLIAADTSQGEAVFRTAGRQLAFDGFLRVMGRTNGDDVELPPIENGAQVAPLQIEPKQQYTSPPPRYSEAALVKKLEAEGIGRPSTYAAIIQTIQDRGYVDLVEKRLHPTHRGEVVTDKLIEHFPKVMDVKFTSHMEEELDKVEDARMEWVDVLTEFYGPFKAALDKAQVEMERPQAEPSEYTCSECGKQMVYRFGKNGRFLACSGFPECKTSMNIDEDGKPIPEVVADQPCTVCGKAMILRKSRLGPFLGCSGYPECTNTLPSDEHGTPLKKVKAQDVKETCDDCASPMTVKFARGRPFMGCSGYPKCKATKPLPPGIYVEKPKPKDAGVRCDKCGRAMVIRSGRRGPFLSCIGFPRCRNAMPKEKIDHLRALEAEGKIPDPPPENTKNANSRRSNANVPRDKNGKIDYEAMGPPPPGFAWTRTGRPVVEVLPKDSLVCPDCGSEVAQKAGRFGPYFSCTAFPKCKFSANLRGEAKKQAEAESPTPAKPKPIPTDVPCDECGELMVIRTGRSGQFLGCSKYPKCKTTKPIPEGMTADDLATTATSSK